MPIPGDNGNPKAEKEAQERRMKDVAEHGTDIKSDLRFYKPKEKPDSRYKRG